MFDVKGAHAKIGFKDQRELEAVITRLASRGFRPALRSMVDSACQVASVECSALSTAALFSDRPRRFSDSEVGLLGEVLFNGDHVFLLVPSHEKLTAWEIRHHNMRSELADFGVAVADVTRGALDGRRLRGMDFGWQELNARPARRSSARPRLYADAQLRTKPPDYDDADLQGAKLLLCHESRDFALRLAEAGGKARSIDANAQASPALTQPLLDAGVLRSEYLVICKQDSHTICATQDSSELDNAKGSVFRCSSCGRAFRDELVRDIFALTDLGKRLLDGSRWMTIWVTDLLIRAGIHREAIAWNATAGEDELDIMTDALGPRVFFELKDRPFGLGDAYPFASRVPRYGGSFGAVLTTDHVAEEAKRYFKEQRPSGGSSIQVVEGVEEIERVVPSLVDNISRSGVTQLVLELSETLGFNFVPLVRAWMDKTATQIVTPLGEDKTLSG